MAISQVDKIIAETTTVKGIQLLKKKLFTLALEFNAQIEFRAYVNAESTDSPNMLSSYADQLKKFQELLNDFMEEAEKKGVKSESYVLSNKKPVSDLEGVISVYRFGEMEHRGNDPHLSLIFFEKSRSRFHFGKVIIIADSELDSRQEIRLNSWCSFLSAKNIVPGVVTIQGRSNFNQLEQLFSKSGLHYVKIDILEREEDLPSYIKKAKPRIIGLPFQHNHNTERLWAYHELNRADIMLF